MPRGDPMRMRESVFYAWGVARAGKKISYEQYLKAKAIVEQGLDLTWEAIE